jgi:hypothetical protein
MEMRFEKRDKRLAVLAATAVVSLLALCPGSRAEENLLVPGAEFSQLVLAPGAWCRYVVVDEALGQVDSSEVYVGLPAVENTARGRAFWIEILSRPVGGGQEEGQILKLLVLEGITGFSDGDSLGGYVLELYIKRGARPVEEKDPRSYEDFSLVVPTAESSWSTADGVAAETAAGRFVCAKKTRTAESHQEIPTGKTRLIRKSRDDYTVWFCDDVPVFRMVRCEIERSRETEIVPRIAGVPVGGKKLSRTTAELTGFGRDAKPILRVDARNQ